MTIDTLFSSAWILLLEFDLYTLNTVGLDALQVIACKSVSGLNNYQTWNSRLAV
jgi:hypothetical protein